MMTRAKIKKDEKVENPDSNEYDDDDDDDDEYDDDDFLTSDIMRLVPGPGHPQGGAPGGAPITPS